MNQWNQINQNFYTPFIIYGLNPRTLDLYLDKVQVDYVKTTTSYSIKSIS